MSEQVPDQLRWLRFEVDRVVSAGAPTVSAGALARLLSGGVVESLSAPVPLRHPSATAFAESSDGWEGPFVGGTPLPKHVAMVRHLFQVGPGTGTVEADGRTYSSLAELEEYERAVACSDRTTLQSINEVEAA